RSADSYRHWCRIPAGLAGWQLPSTSSSAKLREQLAHPTGHRKIIGGLPDEPRSAATFQSQVCPSPREQACDRAGPCYDREHQGTEVVLRRQVEISTAGNEDLDNLRVTPMGSQHQGSLSVPIPGIDVYARSNELPHRLDIATSDRTLPLRVHLEFVSG